MTNFFSESSQKLSDHELLSRLAHPDDFVPEAVEAARQELENRKKNPIACEERQVIPKELQQPASISRQVVKRKRSWRYTRSFLRLVVRPDTHRIRTTRRKRLLLTLRFYFLALVFLYVAYLPMIILETLGIATKPQQFAFIPSYFNNSTDIFFASILIPIMAGFFEEAQFRLVLSKFNKVYFDMFIALAISSFISKIGSRYLITSTEFYSSLLLQSSFVYLALAVPVYFSLARTNIHTTWFVRNWDGAFKYLFYSLALVFALLHLPTFNLTENQLLCWPFLILPFLAYALVFSYVRIRIGFGYAVLLHFFIDLILIFLRN